MQISVPETARFADAVINDIKHRIRGRIAHEQNNCNYLAWAIAQAGDGNHLEIGTLFGGTAILAALVKQMFGYSGSIYCVDPLNGYYIGTQYEYRVDPVCGLPINEETVLANAREFDVEDRIKIIAKSSYPLPEELAGLQFSSAFIDGDHWGEMPTFDWFSTNPITSKYIIFDNWDDAHPAVQKACTTASCTPGWETALATQITYIVRRMS